MFNKYFSLLQKNPEYYGIRRYCNICGFRFSKFAPFGITPREAMCPVCGSLERHRHLYIHLLPLLPFFPGKRVLHFAPEEIIKNFFINSHAEYFDADIVEGKASYVVDIENIYFEDASFDYCIAIHVLEHIIHDMKALSEIYRVLKPGGTAYLIVPVRAEAHEDYSLVSKEDRLEAFGKDDHVRWYSQQLFEERVVSTGFAIYTSLPSHFSEAMRTACLLKEHIVIAKKN